VQYFINCNKFIFLVGFLEGYVNLFGDKNAVLSVASISKTSSGKYFSAILFIRPGICSGSSAPGSGGPSTSSTTGSEDIFPKNPKGSGVSTLNISPSCLLENFNVKDLEENPSGVRLRSVKSLVSLKSNILNSGEVTTNGSSSSSAGGDSKTN